MTTQGLARFAIPDDFPLADLVSQELTNIAIGRHYVRLLFIRIDRVVAGTPKYKDGASIEIEAGFRLASRSGQTVTAENPDLATGAGALIALLEQTIAAVDRLPNNELSLTFSGGDVLVLTVDPQGFESYHLQVGGEVIDVTKEWT
jgi:hypothetical protein